MWEVAGSKSTFCLPEMVCRNLLREIPLPSQLVVHRRRSSPDAEEYGRGTSRSNELMALVTDGKSPKQV